MLVGLTLFILGVLTLFSIILGSSLPGVPGEVGLDGTININDSSTTLSFPIGDFVLIIDPTVATIVVFVVIGGIAAVLGIQALASGLSAESIKVIIACILYGAVWGLLSVLALPLISAIEVFGTIIYMVLLIGYIAGVIGKITGGEIA